MAESIQRKPKGKEEEEESHVFQTIWENSEAKLNRLYLQRSCLTVGEQGGKGLVGGQLGVAWAPAFTEHLRWAHVHTLLRLVLTATLSSGLISPTSRKKCCSFICSIFIESLWGDSGGHDRACPPAAYLAQMESVPRSLASMHTYSSRTKGVPTPKPGEALFPLPGCWVLWVVWP